MFSSVLRRYVASTVLLVPNLSEGADSVGGQLRGDKECCCGTFCNKCPFSGVTNSGRIWRKVPESDARSVSGVKASQDDSYIALKVAE